MKVCILLPCDINIDDFSLGAILGNLLDNSIKKGTRKKWVTEKERIRYYYRKQLMKKASYSIYIVNLQKLIKDESYFTVDISSETPVLTEWGYGKNSSPINKESIINSGVNELI